MIRFDETHAFLKEDFDAYQEAVNRCHAMLMNKSGKGNDYVGWVEWPNTYDKEEFACIKKRAAWIRENCDVFLVCGIGGSYLGARAAIEMINGLYQVKNRRSSSSAIHFLPLISHRSYAISRANVPL